ncbi:MAG TPA: hypothetical protein VL860_00985 [Planctomycetota bacterium]|nr:hypothetical protein [Planctomycetota bacterium]
MSSPDSSLPPPPDDWASTPMTQPPASPAVLADPTRTLLAHSAARVGASGKPGHPLYLLSAMFMLIGCFVVQSSLSNHGVEGVFGLAVTVVGYEVLLAGVAWVLLKLDFWRNLMQLLALAVLFLADPTFTYFRLVVCDVGTGFALMAAVAVLAVAKLWLLRRASPEIGAALTLPVIGLAAAGFAINLAVPFLPALYAAAMLWSVSPGMYLAWWLAAAALALALPKVLAWFRSLPESERVRPVSGAAARALTPPAERITERLNPSTQRWVTYVFLLPLVTLALRLVFLHWLYNEPMRASFLSPLALLMAFRAEVFFACQRPVASALLRLGFLTLGILLSFEAFPMPRAMALITPWALTWIFSALILAWVTGQRRSWFHGTLSVVAAAVGFATRGPDELASWFDGRGRWSLVHLIPSTAAGWGLLTIGAAFLSLLGGLVWNLLQARREQHR